MDQPTKDIEENLLVHQDEENEKRIRQERAGADMLFCNVMMLPFIVIFLIYQLFF